MNEVAHNLPLGIFVAFLTVIVAVNLFLTLRLVGIVGGQAYLQSPMALPPGTSLPRFVGRRLLCGTRVVSSEEMADRAAALLFLSPDCGDCQAKVRELAGMYESIERSGVAVWILSCDSKRKIRELLAGTPLLGRVVMVSSATLRKLNPRSAAPFYVFVDQQMTVLASNFIGDEDWQSFEAQLRETERFKADTSAISQ